VVRERIASLFGPEFDQMPMPEHPRKQAPTPVTTGLRRAAALPPVVREPEVAEVEITAVPEGGLVVVEEGDAEFSLRRLRRSITYLAAHMPRLIELYEQTLREMQRLEQRYDVDATQVQEWQAKAAAYDRMMKAGVVEHG
jgi:hypothetical protein